MSCCFCVHPECRCGHERGLVWTSGSCWRSRCWDVHRGRDGHVHQLGQPHHHQDQQVCRDRFSANPYCCSESWLRESNHVLLFLPPLCHYSEGLMVRSCPWRLAWTWRTKTSRRRQRSHGWLTQTAPPCCPPSASTTSLSSLRLSSPKMTTSKTTLIKTARSVLQCVADLCHDYSFIFCWSLSHCLFFSWRRRCLAIPVWRTWRKETSSSSKDEASTSVTSPMSQLGEGKGPIYSTQYGGDHQIHGSAFYFHFSADRPTICV